MVGLRDLLEDLEELLVVVPWQAGCGDLPDRNVLGGEKSGERHVGQKSWMARSGSLSVPAGSVRRSALIWHLQSWRSKGLHELCSLTIKCQSTYDTRRLQASSRQASHSFVSRSFSVPRGRLRPLTEHAGNLRRCGHP